MIVVPVVINGAGPFDFQLDTGTSSSIVDRRLVEELHLPLTGRAILATLQGKAVTTVAHVDSVSMGDASVTGLSVLVVNRSADLRFKARGVLGEDFLRHFDVYIDNRRHVIQLESGAGQFEDRLEGERLPLSSESSKGEKLDSGRLVIEGWFDGLSGKGARLQLDSGIPYLLLRPQFSKLDAWIQPQLSSVSGVMGGNLGAYAQTAHLQLGRGFAKTIKAFVPTGTMMQLDVDGLLPTSVFQSVFISHSGGFVILDPSVKPQPRVALSEKAEIPVRVSSAE